MSGSLGVNPRFKQSNKGSLYSHPSPDSEHTTAQGAYLIHAYLEALGVEGRPSKEGTGSCLLRPPGPVEAGGEGTELLSDHLGCLPRALLCDSDSTLPHPQSRSLKICPVLHRLISHPLSCLLHENTRASRAHFPEEDTEVQSGPGRPLALLLCPPLALFILPFIYLALSQEKTLRLREREILLTE